MSKAVADSTLAKHLNPKNKHEVSRPSRNLGIEGSNLATFFASSGRKRRFKLLIEQSKRMPEHLFVQMLT